MMSEALLAAVVPQETPRIGTFSHFESVLSDKAPSVPHVLKSCNKKAEAAEKAEGTATCHAWYHKTPKI